MRLESGAEKTEYDLILTKLIIVISLCGTQLENDSASRRGMVPRRYAEHFGSVSMTDFNGPVEMATIPLIQIRANPIALRDANKSSEAFQELIGSIRAQGVQLPILVRRKPGEDGKEFELVDGLQRFTGASEVGTGVVGTPGVIPVRVVEKDDADALLAQIVGNAHRIETKPAEYAKAILRILGYSPTMTEAELAAKLNKSPTWINKQLSLLKLGDAMKTLVNEGKIPLINAYSLAKLPAEEQLAWVDRAQTMQPAEFTGAVSVRVKEIRDANRKGVEPGEEKFVPIAHLRKKAEIEEQVNDPSTIVTLARDTNAMDGIASYDEAFRAGAKLALQWSLNFDPKSLQAAEAKWAERKRQEEQDRVRRDAEKKEKRAKELQQKEAAAKIEADKARDSAEAVAV